MKANKAPEKIYVHIKGDKALNTWNSVWVGVNDIEYTNTDAFIEKACDAYCKVCGHYPHAVPTHICRHDCRYFSDFKSYMKRE